MGKVENLMGLGIESQAALELSTDTVLSIPSRSVGTALVATGTVLADSLILTRLVNVIATTAASTGARLPSATPIGAIIYVQNNGANILNLFPPSATGTLNGGSAGAAVTTAAGAGALCVRLTATDWLVNVTAKEA